MGKLPQPGQRNAPLAALLGARLDLPSEWWDGDVRWDEIEADLLDTAIEHQVVVLCAESPLFSQLPAPVAGQFRELATRRKMESFKRATAQREVIAQLNRHDIDVLTLKGMAMSSVLYGNFLSRGGAGDIDLMVSPNQLHRAESALRDIGVTERSGRNLPPTGGRLSKYLTWLHYERGYESSRHGTIDLHWRLLPGSAHWTTFESAWESRREVDLPTGRVWTLGPVQTILVAAGQGESDAWRRAKRILDLWMAWKSASPAERDYARAASPLFARSPGRLLAYWDAALRPQAHNTSRLDSVRCLWRTRRGSGDLADAAAKSMLGQFAPARRLQRFVG